MTEHVRSSLAFVIARITHADKRNGVYDHTRQTYVSISGFVDDSVDVYNHESKSTMNGSVKTGIYRLYDYRSGSRLSLDVKDNVFEGSCDRTGSPFNGHVEGSTVHIHDHENESWFLYEC